MQQFVSDLTASTARVWASPNVECLKLHQSLELNLFGFVIDRTLGLRMSYAVLFCFGEC